jgi:hypothetical protein
LGIKSVFIAPLSFPRRREARRIYLNVPDALDARLRGHDGKNSSVDLIIVNE